MNRRAEDRHRQIADRLRAAGCVFAEDEAAILLGQATTVAELDRLVSRRAAGEPLEHVVGWAEFAGHRISVDPGVFVPRRRSELLARLGVQAASRHSDRTGRAPVVVDLCCGSGSIGAVVAARASGAVVHAADLDPVAVRCARRNLPAGRVHQGDLFAALPPSLRGNVDVLIVNAPYVPTADLAFLPTEAREHEPRLALDGGADGVEVHRRVAADASGWLAPDGVVLTETSRHQCAATIRAFLAASFGVGVVHDDDLGATVVRARRAAPTHTS